MLERSFTEELNNTLRNMVQRVKAQIAMIDAEMQQTETDLTAADSEAKLRS